MISRACGNPVYVGPKNEGYKYVVCSVVIGTLELTSTFYICSISCIENCFIIYFFIIL